MGASGVLLFRQIAIAPRKTEKAFILLLLSFFEKHHRSVE